MKNLQVKVHAGRNKGQVGNVLHSKGNDVYVDFGGSVLVNEGFGSMANYPNGYWVRKENVEKV